MITDCILLVMVLFFSFVSFALHRRAERNIRRLSKALLAHSSATTDLVGRIQRITEAIAKS